MDMRDGLLRMMPNGPAGPVERRRTTVRSKMWTPSSFSVAMSRHPLSGSWMAWAHLSPTVTSCGGGCAVRFSSRSAAGELFPVLAVIKACSLATIFALNHLQSACRKDSAC
ncbi:unnamed protein product [Linum tenue]|uniref:Uncharacterized protein n=1 Tax=Linum tenue TaxID=586396 RepID=A0AAV0N5Z0_9ROSI|nr:unnamed protein product [Linum tenue]